MSADLEGWEFEDWFANTYPETYADYRSEWLESEGRICKGCGSEVEDDGHCLTPGCDQGT